ncbi:MAG: hypothetical protein D6689_12370, partial [Deltaproteobacteria bacterium]
MGAVVAAAAVSLSASACVVRETRPARVSAQGSLHVRATAPNPYYVSAAPPQPLYEEMTPAPGPGYVWVDGYWHWNGYDWEWIPGQWVVRYDGYVYIEPYYGFVDGRYVYVPGYWAPRNRLPRGVVVRDHRDGRPPRGRYTEEVPANWGTPRPPRDHRRPPARPPGGTVVVDPVPPRRPPAVNPGDHGRVVPPPPTPPRRPPAVNPGDHG